LQFHGYPALARARQSLYGAARIGDLFVTGKLSPRASGWAIIVLSAAALALGGCGRKSGLDLPPNASSQADTAAVATDTEAERASKPSVFNPYYGTDAPPTAPRGTKKSFILDPLLNSN
jgi:predicted small lipoprotein YifL